jgi:hypothetical protein
MEKQFVMERKKQEEQYNDYRKTLTDQVEQLRKKNNELELAMKLSDGENEKNI